MSCTSRRVNCLHGKALLQSPLPVALRCWQKVQCIHLLPKETKPCNSLIDCKSILSHSMSNRSNESERGCILAICYWTQDCEGPLARMIYESTAAYVRRRLVSDDTPLRCIQYAAPLPPDGRLYDSWSSSGGGRVLMIYDSTNDTCVPRWFR